MRGAGDAAGRHHCRTHNIRARARAQPYTLSCGVGCRANDGSVLHFRVVRNTRLALQDPTMLLKWNVWAMYRAVHDPDLQVVGWWLMVAGWCGLLVRVGVGDRCGGSRSTL